MYRHARLLTPNSYVLIFKSPSRSVQMPITQVSAAPEALQAAIAKTTETYPKEQAALHSLLTLPM